MPAYGRGRPAEPDADGGEARRGRRRLIRIVPDDATDGEEQPAAHSTDDDRADAEPPETPSGAVPLYGRARPAADQPGDERPKLTAIDGAGGEPGDDEDDEDEASAADEATPAKADEVRDGGADAEGDDGPEEASGEPALGDDDEDDDGEDGPGPAYRFGDGPAPVHAGGEPAGAIVRSLRSVPAGDDGRSETGPSPVVRALVHDLRLERLLGTDEASREARSAVLRRVGVGLGVAALAGVGIYAVFPVRTMLDQRAATERSREQIEMLHRENERLERRAAELRTDEEIERLAREQYGYVMPGEEPYAIFPPPEPTTTTTTPPTTTPPPTSTDPASSADPADPANTDPAG
ncbi:MAG TPA: septum formation initiator family protein [Acidimicrobiales bacterium]